MSSNPFDIEELLGAYALDALDDDERRAVEDYLLANPRARAEVQEHREVATMLAWSGMDAPEGLWDRIAGHLEGSESAPESELGHVLPMRASSRRRSPMRTIGSWAVATAAAALIAVAAVRISSDDSSTTKSAGIGAAAEDALSNPQSVQAELTSGSSLKVRAVIDPDGHGYLFAGSLPPLDSSHTYQLWGQVEGQDSLISLGLLGASPKTEQFTVKGHLSLLAITEEAAGGVVSSSNPAVVAGAPA
jgi:anti-sigma-K factor RskA